MTIYLPSIGSTSFAVPMYKDGNEAQAAWCRVKPWDRPVVQNGTLTISQVSGASSSGSTLTLE